MGWGAWATEALENGIIDKALECLYQLNRYDSDEEYRKSLGGEAGLSAILARRREIASLLESMRFDAPGVRH
jgi:hypothetical protein